MLEIQPLFELSEGQQADFLSLAAKLRVFFVPGRKKWLPAKGHFVTISARL